VNGGNVGGDGNWAWLDGASISHPAPTSPATANQARRVRFMRFPFPS
jgi:hypothetical protein